VCFESAAQIACLPYVHTWLLSFLTLAKKKIDSDLTALRHFEKITDEATGHLNDLHDTGRDLGHTNTLRLPAGKKDLDGFGSGGHRSGEDVFYECRLRLKIITKTNNHK
jgi:hypothetical protein